MKTRTNQPVVAEGTPSGTIDKVLGVDANGSIVKGTISGGTQLYKHQISTSLGGYYLISLGNTPFTAHPITNSDEAIKILVAYFGDGQRIVQFYADSNDDYKEKYCSINLSGMAQSSVPNYQSGLLGTFVSDTVTSL